MNLICILTRKHQYSKDGVEMDVAGAELRAAGYKKVKCIRCGVPRISFLDRTLGKPKLITKDQLKHLRHF